MSKILLATFFVTLLFSLPATLFAQDFVLTYKIDDPDAINGDILMSQDGKNSLKRADAAFTSRMFGVLQLNPVVVYRITNDSEKPVAKDGNALVNVTTINGPIDNGNYITSSAIPGKGQKSTQSGYTLGLALESFTGDNGENIEYQDKQYKSGQIMVAVNVQYAELSNPRSLLRLFDLFNIALFQNFQDTNKLIEIVRYIAALIVFLVSIGFGFVVFARSLPKGVEAIGRNPLAKNAIQFSLILNIVFTVITALVGIGAAYLILRI